MHEVYPYEHLERDLDLKHVVEPQFLNSLFLLPILYKAPPFNKCPIQKVALVEGALKKGERLIERVTVP